MSEARASRRARRGAAALLLLAVTLVGAEGAGPSPAAAIDPSRGRPGFCTNGTGVTVVVDFQQLGGETYVRCFPSASPGTGLDALRGAGFQIEGVRRWGESFVCRIENRPSAVEHVALEGDPDYTERCIETPPAGAYWSYWYAGNNCTWNYSQWGLKNRRFLSGGFEGWSFSLNASADDNPVPRIAPVRPGTEGGACSTDPAAPATPAPTAVPPASTPRAGSGSPTPGSDGGEPSGTTPGSGGSTTPGGEAGTEDTPSSATTTRDAATDTTVEGTSDAAAVAGYSGGEDAPDVRDVVRDEQGGAGAAPWVAAVVVAAIAAGTFRTARHRRVARGA